MTYEIASGVLLLVVAYLVHRHFGLTQLLNPFVMFWLYHVVFLFVGLFYRSFYEHAVTIQPAVIIMIWTGMGFCLFGAMGAKLFAGVPTGTVERAISGVQITDSDERFRVARLLFAAGAFMVLIYFALVGGIPLLHDNADDFRIEARMGKGGLVLLALALLKYAVYSIALLSAARGRSLLRTGGYILLAGLLVVGVGNRAPALELLVFASVIYYAVKGTRPSAAKLISVGLIALVLMAVLGIVRQGQSLSTILVLLKMIWRPFANIQNLEWVYESFPTAIPFQYGYGYVTDALVVLPGYSPNFGMWFKEQAGFDFTGGSITVSYLGEIYANLGWVGVIPLAFLYGFGLVWLFYHFTRRRRPDDLMLLVIFATTLKSVVSSGLVSVLLYETFMLLGIHAVFKACLWGLRVLSRKEDYGPVPESV